jgi:regulatory protein
LNEFLLAEERVKADCLRLLSIRDHSQQELFQKLSAKGHSAELIKHVINDFAKNNWQSDQRYAESYARQRLQKGFGNLRVSYELKQHGIEVESFRTWAEDLAGDEMDLLEQLYLKKYSPETNISRNEWAKRFRFLLQRGFPANLINELFKRLHHKLI